MKKIFSISLLLPLLLFITNCERKTSKTNHFTSQNDTLLIEMIKKPGSSMFEMSASTLVFQDLNDFEHYSVTTPDTISEIKIGLRQTDWNIYRYLRYKKGEISNEFVIKDVIKNKLDTTFMHDISNSTVTIMSGKKDNKKIFIVDENNNKNFKDDTIRTYKKIDWDTPNLIKCKHLFYNGKKMIEDYSWLNIGTSKNKVLVGNYHHSISNFILDNNSYEIAVTPNSSDFSFDEPLSALISENGVKKDSLPKSEILELGEYFKLNNKYYKFESITNDGSEIKLVKENDVSDKTGTQVGFIAPNFEAKTIKNDSISLHDYNSHFLLITNITSCYSPINSYESYKGLYEKYNSKLKILAIDNSPNFLNFQINRLNLKGDFIIGNNNPSVKENYRQDFCSRTCFLINPKGSIVEKFEISDWKRMLSKHFKN